MNTTLDRLSINIRYYFISSFFTSLAFIIPIWVSFEKRILTYAEMALLEVVGATFLVLLQIPTGALADLIGRKKTIVLGWVTTGLGNILFAHATNFPTLVATYLIVNFGFALVAGADVALIYDSLKEAGRENDFQKIASKKSLISQIALVIGTVFGGYIYQIGYRLPFILFGLFEIFGGLLVLFMIEPHVKSVRFTVQSYIDKNIDGMKEIFKNIQVRELSIFYILVGGLTWSTQFFFNQPFATDIGLTDIEKSWYFAFLRLVNSLVLFKMVSIKSLVTKKRAFLFFPIMMICVYLPGIFATKISGALLVWLSVFLGTARFSILDQYVNDEYDSKHRATALSTLSMCISIIYIVMMAVSGPIMQNYSTKAVYSLIGILSIILVAPLGFILYKNHK